MAAQAGPLTPSVIQRLCEACKNGEPDEVKNLLDARADIKYCDEGGKSLLSLIVSNWTIKKESDYYTCLKLLLESSKNGHICIEPEVLNTALGLAMHDVRERIEEEHISDNVWLLCIMEERSFFINI